MSDPTTEPTPAELGPRTVLHRPMSTRVRRFRGRTLVATSTDAVELDEVGELVFSRVDGTRSVEEIGAAVADVYDVSLETAVSDAIELLVDLVATGVVVTGGPGSAGPGHG